MGLTDKAAVLVFVQRKDQMGQYDEMSKVLSMGPRVMSSASPSVTKPSQRTSYMGITLSSRDAGPSGPRPAAPGSGPGSLCISLLNLSMYKA